MTSLSKLPYTPYDCTNKLKIAIGHVLIYLIGGTLTIPSHITCPEVDMEEEPKLCYNEENKHLDSFLHTNYLISRIKLIE
jgi:hypothetical protein